MEEVDVIVLDVEDDAPVVRVPAAVETAHLNHTDIGNGERLALLGETWLRYVPGVGWLVWHGNRWVRDEAEGQVGVLAKFATRGIYREQAYFSEQAADATDDTERQKWSIRADAAGKHARNSEHASRVAAMIKMARSEEAIMVQGEDGHAAAERLDADPGLLNVRNGTLHLDTMTLRDHDPADLITKVTNASYVPGAEAPHWRAFMEMVIPDPETRSYVQRVAGYSLLGSYSEFLPVACGHGANGKSTFLAAMSDVLGEYAASMPAELLTPRKGGKDAGAYSALAKMRGVRLVTTTETEQGHELSESFVKELTGEGILQAKFMHRDMFEFQNKTSVWLATNHLPLIKGNDYAIWRRLRLIPFDVTIPESERIEPSVIKERFRAERDGILMWMLEGLTAYRETSRLDMPPAVEAATSEWQREMDPMSDWVAECLEFGPDFADTVATVRNSYETHARASGRGDFLIGPRKLNDMLKARGCKQEQKKLAGTNTRVWIGVRVIPQVSEVRF